MRKKLLLIPFGVVFTVVLVAITEGILGVIGYAEAQVQEDPFVGFEKSHPLFSEVERDGRTYYVVNESKRSWFNHQAFPKEKSSDTYRVFCFGGSTTYGRPYGHETSFSAWLGHLLREADPSRTYEVINAGGISYASYRIVNLVREIRAYEPDLFIIYTGHNEFLESRTYHDLLSRGRIYRKLGIFVHRLRTRHLLRAWMPAVEDEPETGRGTIKSETDTILAGFDGLDVYERDDEQQRRVVTHFRYNLDRILALTRKTGVDVILVDPASNTRDFSPFKSQHREGLASAERDRVHAAIAQGRDHRTAGRHAEAVEAYESANDQDPLYAQAAYELGRAYEVAGDPRAAEQAFHRAKELDVAPLRCLDALHGQIAEAARAPGASLVEIRRALEQRSLEEAGHHALGNAYFADHVHPRIEIHQFIAEQLLAEMVRRGIVMSPRELTNDDRKRIYSAAVSALPAAYYDRKDLNLGKVLFWAGKHEEAATALRTAVKNLPDTGESYYILGLIEMKKGNLNDAQPLLEKAIELRAPNPGLPSALAQLHLRLGRVDQAIAIYAEELSRSPEDPTPYYNMGVALGEQGDLDQSIAFYSMALGINPEFDRARNNLRVLLSRRHEIDIVAARLAEALEGRLDDPALLTQLGDILSARGSIDAAVGRYYAALAANPDYEPALLGVAAVWIQKKLYDNAMRYLARTLRIRSDLPGAHKLLGDALRLDGRPEQAAVAYRVALGIRPDMPEAHGYLGRVLEATGDRENALRHYDRALELRPGWEEIEMRRDALVRDPLERGSDES